MPHHSDDTQARADFLQLILQAMFDRPRFRAFLGGLAIMVQNGAAALCYQNIIHAYENAENPETCFSIKDFMKIFGYALLFSTLLTMPEIYKKSIARPGRRGIILPEHVNCKCKNCFAIIAYVGSALARATATTAGIAAVTQSGLGFFKGDPCPPLNTTGAVVAAMAGFWVLIFQSTMNLSIPIQTTAPCTAVFMYIGNFLKHIPLVSPLIIKEIGELFRKQTEGTITSEDKSSTAGWLTAYLVMLCIMGFAHKGSLDFVKLARGTSAEDPNIPGGRRIVSTDERDTLIQNAGRMPGYPASFAQPSSWLNVIVALVCSGIMGYLPGKSIGEALSRELVPHPAAQDTPRFQAPEDPLSRYMITVVCTLLMMAGLSVNYYLGLQGLRKPKCLTSCFNRLQISG
jgi:hypothetical protein